MTSNYGLACTASLLFQQKNHYWLDSLHHRLVVQDKYAIDSLCDMSTGE